MGQPMTRTETGETQRERTREMTIRFYAADLAAYNAGHLHGAWIDATSDTDEMQEAVNAMLAASPVPGAEEWLVHDYDDELRAISHLGETSDLATIAEIMDAVEEIEADYPDAILPLLISWAADHTDPANWKSALDDAFAGEWSDPEDYAAELVEGSGQLDSVPEALRGYIDFCAMARDMALGGEMDFICTSTGQHLQDYDSMRGRECVALRNL